MSIASEMSDDVLKTFVIGAFLMFVVLAVALTVLLPISEQLQKSNMCGCGPMCRCNGTLEKFIWKNDSFVCPCEGDSR